MSIGIKYFLTMLIVTAGLKAGSRSLNVSYIPACSLWNVDSLPGLTHERTLRYHPDGNDFVILNGNKRYNRALYGTHTAFRVEAGDLPEFALYLPGIGGDMKLGIITSKGTKWLNDFDTIEARYRPGTMLYRLKDHLLGKAEIHLQLLAMADREGMILKTDVLENKIPLQFICVYGGASGIHPSRNGDIGADPPSVFYLTPEHAKGNQFNIKKNQFDLFFKDRKRVNTLQGVTPAGAELHIGDADKLQSPQEAFQSAASASPVLVCDISLRNNEAVFFAIQRKTDIDVPSYNALSALFVAAERKRKELANRMRIHTPDPFLNTVGGTLSVAADAVWESPAFMHGAVAWRMALNGWRGAYLANDLGWHDRAKIYFTAYNKSQLTEPDTTIATPDPKKNGARQEEKIGVGIFNSGYISRYPGGEKKVAHHYDMNLVYIDAMLRNFQWTGDTAFLRECWPVIKRHLAWEKRNFDADGNGLYDAYACIWASDALQYSGGDVAHSSSYNYYANKIGMRIASILGDDVEIYRKEAEKIHHAMNQILWMPAKGWYAEYKDRLGLQRLHPDAGLWTIYHAIDSKIPDAFQAYQLLRYIDNHIPRIPIKCDSLRGSYYVLSTSDWMPYTWSVNNVAMAEIAHTALAYWEGNRKDKAFNIWKSLILESMYLGSSPGNFEQLSYYDRYRGELYRDFADPVGISSRALVEGLFGIRPDALSDTLLIQPGWPDIWEYASFSIPDIKIDYHRNENDDYYKIIPSFAKKMNLKCRISVPGNKVDSVWVNDKPVAWNYVEHSIGKPVIEFCDSYSPRYNIRIKWLQGKIAVASYDSVVASNSVFNISINEGRILNIKDPQRTLSNVKLTPDHVSGKVAGTEGDHTLFLQVKQDKATWWMPVNYSIHPPFEIQACGLQDSTGIRFFIRNNTIQNISQPLTVQSGDFLETRKMSIPAHHNSSLIFISAKNLLPGTNPVKITTGDKMLASASITNRSLSFITKTNIHLDRLDIFKYFNDRVTQIFKNKYLSPRPDVPTLQLPEQGIGNWCSPLINPVIDDSGLRRLAGSKGYFQSPNGISFATPGAGSTKNIAFVSQWDNYPDSINIPLKGSASHAYLLMAGSTNPMQTRIVNGKVIVYYTDGSADSLLLKNPGTWWPIEQDYRYDQYAFHCNVPVPFRVHLQTGLITRHFSNHQSIKGLTDMAVAGGAATILDMPLDPLKILKSFQLKATANDVVIGLMSVTLLRNNYVKQ